MILVKELFANDGCVVLAVAEELCSERAARDVAHLQVHAYPAQRQRAQGPRTPTQVSPGNPQVSDVITLYIYINLDFTIIWC